MQLLCARLLPPLYSFSNSILYKGYIIFYDISKIKKFRVSSIRQLKISSGELVDMRKRFVDDSNLHSKECR